MRRGRKRGQARRKQSRRKTQVRMHGWDDTHEAILSHKVQCEHCASTGGAQACSVLRVVRVRVRDGVLVVHRSVLKRDVVMREGVRNVVTICT